MFFSLCCILLGFQILLANICLRTFFDIPFTLFLMLVIKSELYDIISCTSLGIVPVHYTFMYMDEREESSRLVKTWILLISVYDVKQMLSIRLSFDCSHHKPKQSAHARPTRITQTWSQVCQVRVVRPLKSYCVTAEHVDTPNLS